MNLEKWLRENQKQILEVALSVAALVASIAVHAMLPDHDSENPRRGEKP